MNLREPITVDYIPGADSFAALASEWDALAQRGMTDTPFQTHAYQQAWWTHLGPGELHTIAVRREDELVGIGCFYLLDGTLYFNGSKEESDYLDVIAVESDAEMVWAALFDCLCQPHFPAWSALDLCNIPADSPTRIFLPEIAAQRGFSFASTQLDVCPIIPLPATFDDYLEQIDSKQRHEIKRKLRRATGAEAQLVAVAENDDVHTEVDSFLDLLQRSTPEKQAWLNTGRSALFHDVAAAALRAGTLQLVFLEVDQQRAASLFNFVYKDRIWVYNSGLAPNVFGPLSLGTVLTSLSIQSAIEQGYTRYDFLRGDETYKYRFGAEDTAIYRLSINR